MSIALMDVELPKAQREIAKLRFALFCLLRAGKDMTGKSWDVGIDPQLANARYTTATSHARKLLKGYKP